MLNRRLTLLTLNSIRYFSRLFSSLKESSTFFSLWDIDPPTFKIDKRQLQLKYRELQKQLHPDKSAGLSSEEQSKRAELSAWVNQGYFTLKNDFERALYLVRFYYPQMRLRDIEIIQQNEKWEDTELTMRVFEIREGIEDAQTFEELQENWKRKNEQRIDKLTQQIEDALNQWELNQDTTSVKRLLIELRYELTISEAIDRRERQFKGLL